jgi:hypothetical protein
VLLVHLLVVFAPSTGALLVVCGVWPAARRRLVWVVAAAAAAIAVLTPLTVDAGEWLQDRLGTSPDVTAHARLGDTMVYVSAGLVAGALLVVALHLRDRRASPPKAAVTALVAVLAVAVGVAGIVQVYRIGESGARAAWADRVSTVTPSTTP